MNNTDIYSDLIYDYIHNKCKIDPNDIYIKTTDPIKKPLPPHPLIDEEFGTKDIFYNGGSNQSSNIRADIKNDLTHIIHSDTSNNIDETASINLSFQSHIISILKTPPFNILYSIDELTQLLPTLSKYSTYNLNYTGPDKLNNYLRQYTEVLSSALIEKLGRETIENTISLGKWNYLNDIDAKYIACLLQTDNIYITIIQYIFLCYNIQRQLPRYEIIIEASKHLSKMLSKWMYEHRYQLLPDGTVLNTSLNEYGKQYMNEFNNTYELIKNNRNFFNPFDSTHTNSQIFQNWDNLDIIYKYLLSLQFNIKPSKYEFLSLSCFLNKPIFIMTGYKSELIYSVINVYTPFKYNKLIDIPISIIMNNNNNYHLLWFKHFGIPSTSLCNYPKVNNQIIHNDKKPIKLNIIGSSRYIINKEPFDIITEINTLDKSLICDVPSFLKQLSNSHLSITPTLSKMNNKNDNINIEKTYKIGKFTYTNKIINIDKLTKKILPKSILNADIPIDIFIFMKHGAIQLFNLSNKLGQAELNKAYKNGFIIRPNL
jgi:hypothetical protein